MLPNDMNQMNILCAAAASFDCRKCKPCPKLKLLFRAFIWQRGKGKGREKKRLGQRDISHQESSKTLNPKNPNAADEAK
jgi:hypothetical protein